MRNKSKILEEIVELSGIKSAYNHYLASSRSLSEVENATQVGRNRDIVCAELNQLYRELRSLPSEAKQDRHSEASVRHNPAEQVAIQLFNRDRRFSITE